MTINFTGMSKLPPEFVALILKATELCVALGVPVIAPVDVLKLKPSVVKRLCDVLSRL